jgi:hypothetical protein
LDRLKWFFPQSTKTKTGAMGKRSIVSSCSVCFLTEQLPQTPKRDPPEQIAKRVVKKNGAEQKPKSAQKRAPLPTLKRLKTHTFSTLFIR